ncbi:MAG: hemolysin family protein [Verrucomicrobiota bacterium]|jgi:CBS domain containing-hemolysin-like protein
MFLLLLAIGCTVTLSFFCSLFEAVVLSTTVAEIESLKKSKPVPGLMLEEMKHGLDQTISAILTMNTIANSIGSVMVGAISAKLFNGWGFASATFCFGALLTVGSEVLPKSIGVVQRKKLQPVIVYPLYWLRKALLPLTYVCHLIVRPFVGKPPKLHRSDEEIILLAELGAKQGTISKSESNIITNALLLEDLRVTAIMTPRTVMMTLRSSETINDVFAEHSNLPFGRIPVIGKGLDDIVGLVRRRDLLKAKANDQDAILVEQLMGEVHFVPETATIGNALQLFLKAHQQLLIVVDEFGATAGVVTMEDVIEHLLGREIFEKDDLAVDMREFARNTRQKQPKYRKSPEPIAPVNPRTPTV